MHELVAQKKQRHVQRVQVAQQVFFRAPILRPHGSLTSIQLLSSIRKAGIWIMRSAVHGTKAAYAKFALAS